MGADLSPERKVKPRQRLCMEAAQTTTSASTSHFVPNIAVLSTVDQTLIWPRYTPVRPRTPLSPPPVSSFASESTVPSFCPRVPTYPGRDPWRGDVRRLLRAGGIQPRKERTRAEN